MSEKIKKGIQFALVAATISGFSIFYNKIVLIKGVDPVVLNIFKNGGVALLLSLFILFRKDYRSKIQLAVKNNFYKLLIIGIIGGSIPFLLFFEGLKLTTAINAAIIQKSLFVWVALLAVPLLKERLSTWQIAGYILVLYSNLFIGGFSGIHFGTGEIMILLATFFWTAEALLAKVYLKNIDSTILVWARMFFGAIVLLLFALMQNKITLVTHITPQLLLPIVGSVAFLTMYAVSYYKALSKAPVTLVTALLILSTPITNLLTASILTHTLPSQQLMSTITTILGLVIIFRFLPKLPLQNLKGK